MNVDTLRLLKREELPNKCEILRQSVIQAVEKSGGHLGASLGVIELTVALHYCFDTPIDKLVWDVGHQAYAHKLLTERNLKGIRQIGGISGFPKRSESVYDAFGTGHSSTSISAALGMAMAEKQLNPNSTIQHIAVIGDGAMTAGMAYEALHHAVDLDVNLLIILNDNGMSISENVGGISTMLKSKSRSSEWFYALGLPYSGPFDGHDVIQLSYKFEEERDAAGVRVMHIKTTKGKGYKNADTDLTRSHAIKAIISQQESGRFPIFQEQSAEQAKSSISSNKSDATYSDLFGSWLCNQAQNDDELHVITPAMIEGSGLAKFAKAFPTKITDVGIAEQHAITLAAGMAAAGLKPIVAIYSTFLQRGYDQLIHDVALQNLNVMFAIDRAGIVGEDGATHSGAFDIAFSRCIPNLTIAAPAAADDFNITMDQCYQYNGPTLIRYPKGQAAILDIPVAPLAKSSVIYKGKNTAILVFGTLLYEMLDIAMDLNATLVNMRYIKPLDTNVIKYIEETHANIVTVEEGAKQGGIGEYIASLTHLPTLSIGLPDILMPHGARSDVLSVCHLDKQHILKSISDWLVT